VGSVPTSYKRAQSEELEEYERSEGVKRNTKEYEEY
jgi:hypothetical protein